MKSGLKIGVLAVQGAFIEHKRMLESLGCECVELRRKSDICDLDGLVLRHAGQPHAAGQSAEH